MYIVVNSQCIGYSQQDRISFLYRLVLRIQRDDDVETFSRRESIRDAAELADRHLELAPRMTVERATAHQNEFRDRGVFRSHLRREIVFEGVDVRIEPRVV